MWKNIIIFQVMYRRKRYTDMTHTHYSTIVLLGNTEYMSQVKYLKSPNVFILDDATLTFGDLCQLITQRKKQFPSDTLWLAFTGAQAVTKRVPSQACLRVGCSNPFQNIELDPSCENLSITNDTLKELSNFIVDIRDDVLKKIPEKSDFHVIPPLPVSLISEENFEHNLLHSNQRSWNTGQFTVNSAKIGALLFMYNHVCKDLALRMSKKMPRHQYYGKMCEEYRKMSVFAHKATDAFAKTSYLSQFLLIIGSYIQSSLSPIAKKSIDAKKDHIVYPEKTKRPIDEDVIECIDNEQGHPSTSKEMRKTMLEIQRLPILIPFKHWDVSFEWHCELILTENGFKTSEPIPYKKATHIYERYNGVRVFDSRLAVKYDNYSNKKMEPEDRLAKETRLNENLYSRYRNEIIKQLENRLDRVIDVASYKTKRCTGTCTHKDSCPYFHSDENRRRNPVKYNYGTKTCTYNSHMCPIKEKCLNSHNIYEKMYHPTHFHMMLCPSKTIEKCTRYSACKFYHNDSPEMLYTENWHDLLVYGLLNTFDYLAAAIREAPKNPDYIEHTQVYVISLSSTYLASFQTSLNEVANLYNAEFIDENGSQQLQQNGRNQKFLVHLGSPSNISRAIEYSYRKTNVLIFDDINELLRDAKQSNYLWKISQFLNRKNCWTNAPKIFVGDAYSKDLEGTVKRFLAVNLKTIQDPPEVIDLMGSTKKDDKPMEIVQPLEPPAKKKRIEVVKPSQFLRNEPSTSVQTPVSEEPNDDIIVLEEESLFHKEFEQIRKNVEAEEESKYKAYLHVPDLHPKYETFLNNFESYFEKLSKRSPNVTRDEQWLKFWKVQLESDRYIRTKERLDKIKNSLHCKTTPDNEPFTINSSEDDPNFTMKGTFEILDQVKSRFGVLSSCITEVMKTVNEKGMNNPETLNMFADPELVVLFEMVMEKMRQLKATSQFSAPIYETGIRWIKILLHKAAQNNSVTKTIDNFYGIDMDSIAKMTLGKDVSYVLSIIKTTLKCEGIQDTSKENLNKLYLEICKRQFNLATT